MEATRRILQYLKGNPGQGILLCSYLDLQVYAFCDSNWGACPLNKRSLTSFLVTLGGSPVAWKTKKHATMSCSSAKAKYRAMATATSEMIQIKSLLGAMGCFLDKPMNLFCDNQATLHIAKNPIFQERTKHIKIDCYFVRERLLLEDLVTSYVPSKLQVADIFTKSLGKQQFMLLKGKLGMINSHAPP